MSVVNAVKTPSGAIVCIVIAMVPMVALSANLAGTSWAGGPLIAAIFAMTALLSGFFGSAAKPVLGLSLIGQSAALTASLAGHPWQIDSHMTFFAFIAVLTILRDIRTIVVATVGIALHHVAFGLFLPSFVYPTTDLLVNIERTVFHAVVVLIEAGVLIMTLRLINILMGQNAARMADLDTHKAAALTARDEALAAQEQAETNAKLALTAQQSAEKLVSDLKAQAEQAAQAEERAQASDKQKDENTATQRAEMHKIVEALGDGLHALANQRLDTRLTIAFPGAYDGLRKDFNQMASELHAALQDVGDQAKMMVSEAEQIGAKMHHASGQAGTQAEKVQQSSNKMQSVEDEIRQTATMAAGAAKAVERAEESTKQSGLVVSRAATAMTEIDQSSEEIEKIVSVIEQIAFQTNLLALNAGVEAARAGDAGRGFAVVASEVRALAQRSSEAAGDISELITNSQTLVKDGVKYVGETVETLEAVQNAVSQISTEVDQMANMSLEQAGKIGIVSGEILAINAESKSNAATLMDVTTAATQMTTSADVVMKLVTGFVNNGAAEDQVNIA